VKKGDNEFVLKLVHSPIPSYSAKGMRLIGYRFVDIYVTVTVSQYYQSGRKGCILGEKTPDRVSSDVTYFRMFLG